MFPQLIPDEKAITPNDMTAVICVRLHENNPWVLDRLRKLAGYYDPCPPVLIIDFGSEGDYGKQVEAVCTECGFAYLHEPDYDVFSLALARNAACQLVTTDFIFFTDIDFFSTRDMFAQLARTANAASMNTAFDVILDFPAYHVTEEETRKIEAEPSNDRMSARIEKIGFESQYSAFDEKVEFIAPYSNVFLISKKYFTVLGGYHPIFRGHGSEEFEFFLRAGIYSSFFSMPPDVLTDCHGPKRPDFWMHRTYRGFRDLNQHFASRAERAGLKVFHLWHPTKTAGDWRSHNDWKRGKFREATAEYLTEYANLLKIDALPKRKKVLCICKTPEHWGYFVPLRLHGFELIPVFDDDLDTIKLMNEMIVKKKIDALAVFNPYMSSHQNFYTTYLMAKDLGIETIVVERGALPNTIYYAQDVSYTAPSFSQSELDKITLSDSERKSAQAYVEVLREGELLLEGATPRELTNQKYQALKEMTRPVVFIPLQLDDDMAVTKFVRDSQQYDDFVDSIPAVARANPNILFVIKPHPLSKRKHNYQMENILLADNKDNIHSLLDACQMVIVYNSGVGLLSACHGKPLISIGNAFYNLEGIGHFAGSLEEAVQKVAKGVSAPDMAKVEDLVGKYLFHRYSWFTAKDDIREFAHRQAHGYKKIQVSRSVISGKAKEHVWEKALRPPSKHSYGYAALNMFPADIPAAEIAPNGSQPLAQRPFLSRALLKAAYIPLESRFTDYQKKLYNEAPEELFRNFRNPLLIGLGRVAGVR